MRNPINVATIDPATPGVRGYSTAKIELATNDPRQYVNLIIDEKMNPDADPMWRDYVHEFSNLSLTPETARWLRDRLCEIYGSYGTSVKNSA